MIIDIQEDRQQGEGDVEESDDEEKRAILTEENILQLEESEKVGRERSVIEFFYNQVFFSPCRMILLLIR